jgi:hypothetical protein
MANRTYCSNIAEELESWSARLHALSDKIDAIQTGDKQRLLPQIEGLHIIMTELDDRLCAMMESCELVENMGQVEREGGVKSYGTTKVSNRNETFDYEIGG